MTPRRPLVIGHRGASADAPENTMPSFERALALGADGIEFDVHLTSDGHAVVIHDALLDRTTDGTGPVHLHTLDQIRALDAGRWFGPEFAGVGVPLLSDVLELPARIFELEIKTWGRRVIDTVLVEVDVAGVMDRVKFTGWGQLGLADLKRRRPEATLGCFNQAPQPWMDDAVYEHSVVGTAEVAGFDVTHVPAAAITPRIADAIRALGSEVHANDIRTPADLDRALAAGATSVSADDTATVLEALGSGH